MGREDFIRWQNFEVLDTKYVTKNLMSDDGIMGPGYSSSLYGQAFSVLFDVKSLDDNVPIKQIEYNGGCFGIERGDKIRAEFFKSTDAPVGDLHGDFLYSAHEYKEREYQEKESASRLEKIGEDGKALALFEIKN